MPLRTHYGTVSEAVQKLNQQGFTANFSIEGPCLVSEGHKFNADDFDIVDVYRYEGNSDPGDEATVYAIQSSSGVKGVLVTGYGMSAEDISPDIMRKLHIR